MLEWKREMFQRDSYTEQIAENSPSPPICLQHSEKVSSPGGVQLTP